jgi:transposase InsO family protein
VPPKTWFRLKAEFGPPAPNLIHHSDRGSQYCSDDYLRLLKDHGMISSMSRKGDCYDCDYVAAA